MISGFGSTGLEDGTKLEKSSYLSDAAGQRLMKSTGIEGGAGLQRGTRVCHRVSKRTGRAMADVEQPLRHSIPVAWDGGGMELLPMSELELL